MIKSSIKSLCLVVMLGVMTSACVTESLDGQEVNAFRKKSKKELAVEASNIKTELSIAYMNAKDYRAAMNAINAALKENDKNEIAWLTRAQINQYLKVYDKANSDFQAALKLKPESAEINNNYGWFLCSVMDKPNEGLPYFDKALSDPTYPTPEVANLNKGICHAKMQQYNLADSYFERALAINPNFAYVFKERARAHMLTGNLNEADRLFRQYQSQVQTLFPDDLLLGWRIARAQGQTQAAFEYEQQLHINFPYADETKTVQSGEFNHELPQNNNESE